MFNDKLLVSCVTLSELFIYSHEGRHLSTIIINDYDLLCDAMWTPRGNIVYTTYSYKVVVMSESGRVITTHTQMTSPHRLSVSSDDIIYLADYETGVYQSTDDDIGWSLVFKSIDGWHCYQVIKVTTDHSDDFWTLEYSGNLNYRLRVYSVDRKHSDGNVTWRDINVNTTNGKHINLSNSCLSYDGYLNIFLSDSDNRDVYAFSVNGQYHSSHHIKYKSSRLAVDKNRQLLYVGQSGGVVEVFELKYGDRGN